MDEGGGYFRIVYQGNDLRLHQARFNANATPKTWTDTIVPMSVLTDNGLTRVGFATDPTPGFHIVYLGLDGYVHNDREDLGTGTWYDQIPPGSIKAAANSIPTFTLGNDGHPHVLYFGSDGFVHNDNYDPVTKTWFDQIPPGSTFTEASPNGSTTYDNTFPVAYSDGTHIHVDVFTRRRESGRTLSPPDRRRGSSGELRRWRTPTSDLSSTRQPARLACCAVGQAMPMSSMSGLRSAHGSAVCMSSRPIRRICGQSMTPSSCMCHDPRAAWEQPAFDHGLIRP